MDPNASKMEFEQWEWDSRLEEWGTKMNLTDEITVDVLFDPKGINENEGFHIVYGQWEKVKENWRKLEEDVADHLLDIHNEAWNDEEPITKDTFISRMTIEAIRFWSDGTAEVYFDDGDLFWGHCILVSLNQDGQVVDADIAG
ncbi:DUF2262 domain-containing protein [Laceyella putida]|uniref:DUF2262 domain-containing protein n=1 Tax=Laceyella putida TaxID=110101 RepID=A0ABW2RL53_9BACL